MMIPYVLSDVINLSAMDEAYTDDDTKTGHCVEAKTGPCGEAKTGHCGKAKTGHWLVPRYRAKQY